MKFEPKKLDTSLIIGTKKLQREDIVKPKYKFDAYSSLGQEIKLGLEAKEEPGFLKKYVFILLLTIISGGFYW